MGAPIIHTKIYAFLKAHPGERFTPVEITKGMGHPVKSITASMRLVCREHPATVKRYPIGTTGRLASYAYMPVNNGARAEAATAGQVQPPVPQAAVVSTDVLVTIPIGNNQSATLTAAQARAVYDQLRSLFGGSNAA